MKPPGKPGIAIYFSTKTTKKDTYARSAMRGFGRGGLWRPLEAVTAHLGCSFFGILYTYMHTKHVHMCTYAYVCPYIHVRMRMHT